MSLDNRMNFNCFGNLNPYGYCWEVQLNQLTWRQRVGPFLKMAHPEGFEPPTLGSEDRTSTESLLGAEAVSRTTASARSRSSSSL